MACGNNGGGSTDNCVCAVLREIARVQDLVSPTETGCCETSCDNSIQCLLGGTQNGSNGPNTIPVILYCGDCQPFEGFGVKIETQGQKQVFNCISSFLFRVCSVDDDCCAVLELLDTGKQTGQEGPCSQFQGNVEVGDIEGTGVCITVDLSCFCAVSCLDCITI